MILKILFLFMVYSLIGWIWETPYVSFQEKKYVNRGFLKGPYIPIYGYACLTIILSMGVFDSINNSVFLIVIQILFISIISAVWEYFTSLGLEIAFKTRWWDYSNRKFNLHGRVALDYTLLFGVGGYLLWRFVNPIFESLYSKLEPNYLLIFLLSFYSIYIIDNIYTFKDLLRLRVIIIKLHSLKVSFAGKYDYIFEKAYNSLIDKDDGFKNSFIAYKNSLRNELINIRNKGGSKLATSIEKKANQLNTLLSKSKNIYRFYSKYPKAPSKSYSFLLRVFRNERNENK
jgi:uncharacterized membrane protein